jgi:hypothetical protein
MNSNYSACAPSILRRAEHERTGDEWMPEDDTELRLKGIRQALDGHDLTHERVKT